MVKVKQYFDNYKIEDPSSVIKKELQTKIYDTKWYKDKSIAITVGSRGIPYNYIIVKSLVEQLLNWGAKPFIVPAMGSHGGAIAEGQTALLESYGISEKKIGAPILSSMEVKKIGTLRDGTPIYCDKYASEADGIVIYNKIKPHTDFNGNWLS
jgi:nickel-dependent lactate racemase